MVAKTTGRVGSPLEKASRWMFTRIIRGLARTLRDEDLTVAQLAAMHVIDQRGRMRQSTLVTELASTPSATSRLVEGLVQRDLIERRVDAGDRRARELSLSARGAGLLDQIGEERTRLIERVTRYVPRPLIQIFLGNLERIKGRIESDDAAAEARGARR